SVPTVANGKVFVGSQAQLTVFGLLPNVPSPMQALGGPAPHASTQILTMNQVRPELAEATTRWKTAGYDVSRLANVTIHIVGLAGGYLGMTQGSDIWVGVNAAGYGWFIDPTPSSDSEFTTPGNQGEQGHMDLLTVLAHELGHVLGFTEQDEGVMGEYL